MILLNQMIMFFMIIGIGYFCGKKCFLNDEGVRIITFIVVNIANPALIIGAGQEDATLSAFQIGSTLLFAIIFYLLLILFSYPVSSIVAGTDRQRKIYRAMITFSNIGFMGMPILSEAYGAKSLIFASLFIFIYNILIYTYGLWTLQDADVQNANPLQKIFNIGTVSCVISLSLYLAHIQLPVFVLSTVKSLSGLTAPLSMMVIGYSLSKMPLTSLFMDTKLLLFAAIKQLLIPIFGMIIIKSILTDNMLINVCFIMLATPVGNMVAMMAQSNEDEENLPAKAVALTTIISVITIPVLSKLLSL